MPTVILLDVSLSMCKSVKLLDSSDSHTVKSLAVYGLNCLVDYIAANSKLEAVSLMLFSSLWERLIGFTREFDTIKSALNNLDSLYDKTNIVNALKGARDLVLEDWGGNVSCNVILVTDGCPGIGSYGEEEALERSLFKFSFPCKLHIINFCTEGEPFHSMSINYFKKVIMLASPKEPDMANQLWVPEKLSLKAIHKMFTKLAEQNYTPYHGNLHCGNLQSPVTVYPPFEAYTQVNDFETLHAMPSKDIVICGFMPIENIASPPVHSRHLMFSLPIAREESKLHSVLTIKSHSNFDIQQSTHNDIEESMNMIYADETKQPSLTVLLHGSLKVESMVAICRLGTPNWYGMIYSWADSRKKSNLMISTFKCGLNAVPWLGQLNNLGFPDLVMRVAFNEFDKYEEKKSYSQSCVVWIKQNGLQADIQKVLRLVKKLPEKTANFYKELNRFRKAAITIGFVSILSNLATILERESNLLPATAHPEAKLQIEHAIGQLRHPLNLTSDTFTITPMKAKF